MSWVLMVTMVILLAAIVLIEIRAIREGDERRRRAPGYYLVMVGLIVIATAIAAALSEQNLVALMLGVAGLAAVALGATRHDVVAVH